MKRQLLVVTCLAIGGLLVLLSCSEESGQASRAGADGSEKTGQFECENADIDKGLVDPESVIEFEYSFKNAGTGPLRILECRSGCSCAVVQYDRNRSYDPGETGKIIVAIDTAGLAGRFRRIIQVKTSDGTEPMSFLKAEAIVRAVKLTPSRIFVARAAKDTIVEKRLVAHVIGYDWAELEAVSGLSEGITVVPGNSADSHGGMFHELPMTINIDTSSVPLGETKLTIGLHYKTSAQPVEVTLPVSVSIVGEVFAEPSSVFFGHVVPGGRSRRQCRLRGKNLSERDLKCVSLLKNMKVTLAKAALESDYTIDLEWAPVRSDVPGPVRGSLQVIDGDGTVLLEMPVWGVVDQ